MDLQAGTVPREGETSAEPLRSTLVGPTASSSANLEVRVRRSRRADRVARATDGACAMSVLELLGVTVMLAGMIGFVGPATRLALTGGVAWVTSQKVLVAVSFALMLTGAVFMAHS